MSRYAIGDVHGCSRTLRKLVEELIRLERKDVLFLVGDYIDRGPDTPGVLDYLIGLRERGFHVTQLLGNHEELMLNAIADPAQAGLWYGNWGSLTLEQFGVPTPEHIPRRYIDFLAGLPRILILEDFVLVHAGLNFHLANPLFDTDPDTLLWDREHLVVPEMLGGRTLIHGHSQTPLFEIRQSVEARKPRVCLDNGAWSKGEIGYGNLVSLNLDTWELHVAENCD